MYMNQNAMLTDISALTSGFYLLCSFYKVKCTLTPSSDLFFKNIHQNLGPQTLYDLGVISLNMSHRMLKNNVMYNGLLNKKQIKGAHTRANL